MLQLGYAESIFAQISHLAANTRLCPPQEYLWSSSPIKRSPRSQPDWYGTLIDSLQGFRLNQAWRDKNVSSFDL